MPTVPILVFTQKYVVTWILHTRTEDRLMETRVTVIVELVYKFLVIIHIVSQTVHIQLQRCSIGFWESQQ